MSPDRFTPRKVDEFTIADIEETGKFLERVMPGVGNPIRISEVLELIPKIPLEGDEEIQREVRGNLRLRVQAYSFWWLKAVQDGVVLRGNISVWQKTPDPENIRFEATFITKGRRLTRERY